MTYTAYKFRLYPNVNQERELNSQLETLRRVYNDVLTHWNRLRDEGKKSPTKSELYQLISTRRNAELAAQKRGESGPHWLVRVAAVPLRDTAYRVCKAFDRYFAITKGKIKIPPPKKPRKDGKPHGYPRFKRRGRFTSIPFENYAAGCSLRDSEGKTVAGDCAAARNGYRLEVFGVGKIKCLVHRGVVGKIKTVCVEREPDGKWYVILVCVVPESKSEPSTNPAVGIDVGLEHFLTTSEGEHRPNPRYLKSNLVELRRLQRSVSRKTEVAKSQKRKFYTCRNLQKSQQRVAKLHVRVRNLRKETHRKEAHSLVRKYGTVCVESLSVKNMLKNDKLSRAISDAGWSGFLIHLKHTAAKSGVQVVEVNARGTSQTCPRCQGGVAKTLKDRTHSCPHCGYQTHRDHAAAQVVLQRGLNLNGVGLIPADANSRVTPGCPRTFSPPPIPFPREGAQTDSPDRRRKPNRSQTKLKP